MAFAGELKRMRSIISTAKFVAIDMRLASTLRDKAMSSMAAMVRRPNAR